MPEATVPTIHVRDRFWRVLAPKRAHSPLGGEGAAHHGGRFNEPGVPALYLSKDLMTAVMEYEQDLGSRPGTFCAYAVETAGVVDLTDTRVLAAVNATAQVLRCPWKQIALVEHDRPPTWDLFRRLIDRGCAGLLAPSVVSPSGVNLVSWRWNDAPNRRVTALDPNKELPRDQSS